ncbi:MAG: GxxExxY protein [Patescibacteria group bacterium]
MAVQREDLLYPELSYKILGAAFDVFNKLGWGHKENIYQNALAIAFDEAGIIFEREKFVSTSYNGQQVGKEFLDFVIENKIVVELKVVPKMGYTHINQVVSYLKGTHLELAIMIYFLKDGVRHRRVLNTSK